MEGDNRTRSGAKDPWGRAATAACTAARRSIGRVGLRAHAAVAARGRAKGREQQRGTERMSGVDFNSWLLWQALSERLALKPYWGKPAVRNFRGGDGDIGIIRSPVCAIALLDRSLKTFEKSRLRILYAVMSDRQKSTDNSRESTDSGRNREN